MHTRIFSLLILSAVVSLAIGTFISAYFIAGWVTLWLLSLPILFNFAILLALVTTACKPLRRTIKWLILKARAFTGNILSKIESELFISFVSSLITHRKDTDAKQ